MANPDVVLLSQVAFDKGILVVVAAGNGRQDTILRLRTQVLTSKENSACVSSLLRHSLRPSGGSRLLQSATSEEVIPNGYRARGSTLLLVDLHFWDDNVSCGYGDLYASVVEQSGPAGGGELNYEIDRRRAYTEHFGGTGSSSQYCWRGLCLNGLARQLYGVPSTPVGMRDVAKPYTVEQPFNSNVNPWALLATSFRPIQTDD